MLIGIVHRGVVIVWRGAESLFIRVDHLGIGRGAARAGQIALPVIIGDCVDRHDGCEDEK
jgi:hypothetical protein